MRQNGRIPREYKEILNFRRNMKKNKTGHYETLNGDLFPQDFPKAKMVGKQNRKMRFKIAMSPEWIMGQSPNSRRSTKYGNGLEILMNIDASEVRQF